MKHFTNIHKNKTYNYIIRIAIIGATYYFIYKEIFHKKKLDYVVQSFNELVDKPNVTLFFLWTVVLMFVNWGVEALKWQFLMNKVERFSFTKSYEAIFSGISVSIFTPNRVGEWFGRVFIMKKANPWKGVFITMIGSFSQLLITLMVGSVALLFYIPTYFKDAPFYSEYLFYGMILLVAVIIGALLLVFLNITSIPGFINRIIRQRFVHFNEYINVISTYTPSELITVLIFSFLRYCVFTLQFYILLMMFSVDIPFLHAMIVIAMIFFVMTAIPTVTLAELGIRGSVSLQLIGLYFERFSELTYPIELGILSSTSTLWLINLAFPALVGTLFVYRLTFFRKRKR
jgi:uncharacterized membrane protein YbhN (UPF0104 family)